MSTINIMLNIHLDFFFPVKNHEVRSTRPFKIVSNKHTDLQRL